MEQITISPATALADGCSASLSTIYQEEWTHSDGARNTITDYEISASAATGWRFKGFSWKQRRKETGVLESDVVKEWSVDATQANSNPYHDSSDRSMGSLSDYFADYRGTFWEQYWSTVTWTCYDFVATFERIEGYLSVDVIVAPPGMYAAGCRVSGGREVHAAVGSQANFTLSANPAPGYRFVRWQCTYDNTGSPSMVGQTWTENPLQLSLSVTEARKIFIDGYFVGNGILYGSGGGILYGSNGTIIRAG